MERADLQAALLAAQANGANVTYADDLAGHLHRLGVRALSPDRTVVPRVALVWAVSRLEEWLGLQVNVYPETLAQLGDLKDALANRP
jgi:hypothetical protein